MGSLREFVEQLTLLVPGNPETLTGGYIYDRRIVEGLRQQGWQVDVHSLHSSFPQPDSNALQHARRVIASLPDKRRVVIDGLALAGLSDILQAERERIRLAALIHHPLALETGLDTETAARLREFEMASLAFVRRVIVTSAWTSRALAGYGVGADRLRVVEPGVDVPPPHRAAISTVDGHRPPLQESTLNLLSVATLTPRKGHQVLFNALARLRDRPWRLHCAGSATRDPETARALQLQIERLQLGDRIRLLGEVDAGALELEYAEADVFVLASYMEGYGMALADAIAHGLPVVSTRAGAIPETVPAEVRLLVPAGDEVALANALAKLMDEPETRQRLAGHARTARAKLPTWDDSARKFAAALGGIW